MNCPSCKSDNTQRLEVIYEQGTSNVSATSKTKIRPLFSIIPSATAKTKTKGISITKSAQLASPPMKASYLPPAAGLIVGLAITIWQLGSKYHIALIILGLVALLGSAWLLYIFIRYNLKRWPNEYATWKKSWMCNKCGVIYSEN